MTISEILSLGEFTKEVSLTKRSGPRTKPLATFGYLEDKDQEQVTEFEFPQK